MGNEFLIFTEDSLGCLAKLIIDAQLYKKEAVLKTAYWHTDDFYLYISIANDNYEVELRPKTKCSEDELSIVCRKFLNSLIDYQLRQDILGETQEIREAIIRKAFGEATKKTVPDIFSDSNESQEDGIFIQK